TRRLVLRMLGSRGRAPASEVRHPRRIGGGRSAEHVFAILLMYRSIEPVGLVLDAVGPPLPIEVDAGQRSRVSLGLVRRVLDASGEVAELRCEVLNRIRRALVETRQTVSPDAVRRERVAVGHEIAAADAEHAELVAVLLVDRIHVAELDRAEAAA